MRIDLVIVSYRSERWLERCLGSVYGSGFDGRTWLIDNDELESGLKERLGTRYPRLRYLRSPSNVGFGRGNNLGIERSLAEGADVLGLLNPDAWLEDGWHDGVTAVLNSAADVGLLSPLQLEYDSDDLSRWTRTVLRLDSMGDPRLREPLVAVTWLEASCVFVRREVLERIGGFDPLFTLYYEDNDLCRRAQIAGFGLAVTPRVRYHHYGGGSLDGPNGIERSVRCDLGQALYTLTDPRRTFARNLLDAGAMLGRRLRASLAGAGAQGAGRFWPLLRRVVPLVWERRSAIYTKWKSERAILIADAKQGRA